MKKIFCFLAFLAVMALSDSNAQALWADSRADNSAFNADFTEIDSFDGKLLKVYYYDSFPYELINRKLTINDLYGFNCAELRILRNAIYAYHGYIFKSNDLSYYFSQFDWYYPRFKSEAKVTGMMSKIEKYNIELIKKRERQLGC